MFKYFESFSWAAGTIVLMACFIAFTIAGILLVRSKIHSERLRKHHDVAGYVFTNLGVLYSVLLGFTVVNVQQRFDKIKESAQIEASYINALYRDSEVFLGSEGHDVRSAIKNYAESIINDEWPEMKEGMGSPKTSAAANELWIAYYAISPKTKKEELWYAESLSKLNNLSNVRMARLVGSRESLGTEMWTLLIAGGIIFVGFIWFFGLESTTCHILMGSILAATTAFMLFLIYSLDTAFSGDISVSSIALKTVIHNFN